MYSAPADCHILSLHRSSLDLPPQVNDDSVRLGKDYETCRVLVQAVHYTWPCLVARIGKCAAVVEDGVDQGVVWISSGRVYDHVR